MSRRLLHIVLVLLLFTSCGYRSQEMSEALARAEEMNRNYQSMDTLKGMEQVADYYRPLLGRSQRYMRALYMLGCVYRDRGDAPMALHYYQEAVSHADTTDADCDFHTLCRIYGQMSVLYQRQRSPRLELEKTPLRPSVTMNIWPVPIIRWERKILHLPSSRIPSPNIRR